MRLVLFLFLGLICSEASAGFIIAFSAEVNSGGASKIVIDNRSDADWKMIQAEFDFNMTPAVLTSPGILSTGTYGSYATANTTGGGLALSASNYQPKSIRWEFSGMDSGDGYGVRIGLGDIRGSDINGASIKALFRNINSGREESLEYSYSANGSGRSFPAFASASVPEPGVFGLLAGGLIAIITRRRVRDGSRDN